MKHYKYKLLILFLSLSFASMLYSASIIPKTENEKLSYTIGNRLGTRFQQTNIIINIAPFREGLELANGVYVSLDLKTHLDKLSYKKGYEVGELYRKQEVKLDPLFFQAGLSDGLSGLSPALTHEQQATTIQNFNKKRDQKNTAEFRMQSKTNSAAGKAFLASNARVSGVSVTESGLQYRLVENGKGAKPTAADLVTVSYQCLLLNGKMCSEALQNDQPTRFLLKEMIPGLLEGLQLMQVGSTYTFYIPAKLAYGEQGAPEVIEPNETLVFNVKLIGINS